MFWLVFCVGMALVSCSRSGSGEEPPEGLRVEPAKAYANLQEILAVGARPSGTEAAFKTAELIAAKIKSFGLAPETDSWYERSPAGEIEFRNVTASLRDNEGKLKVIIALE